jgi:hypothetical protein
MYLQHKTQALFNYYLSLQLFTCFTPVNNPIIYPKTTKLQNRTVTKLKYSRSLIPLT